MKIFNEQCPCKDCLIVPRCRHKLIQELYFCDLIVEYLSIDNKNIKHNNKHMKNFPIFYEILKPTKWNYERCDKKHSLYKISYSLFKI